MIIGVDAGALAITDDRLKVGVWRVTFELLKELTEKDTKNEYKLFSFRPIDREVLSAFGTNVQNRVVRPARGWMGVSLPAYLTLHHVDVFLGMSQALPSFGTSYNLGFIYDLKFLHESDAYEGSLSSLTKQTENLVRRSGHIITISEASKKDIIGTYSISPGRVTVCYPGVSSVFSIKGEKEKRDIPYFLSVGALKPGKGIPLALEAFKKFLTKTKKHYTFIFIGGDYWPDPEIDAAIHRFDLTSHVQFLGMVSDIELARYYRGATALIVSSRWEGFCLPAAEAIVSGCPVAGLRSGSLPEVVGDGGILVSPDDSAALSDAMATIAGTASYKKQVLARAGDAGKTFSWDRMATCLLNTYPTP